MTNPLLEMLRKKDKKGLFRSTDSAVSYPTQFATLDYRNGSIVQVKDENENIIDTYPSIGLGAGTITTLVGESQTGKSTLAIQMAHNIVKPFPAGFVQHYDLERSFDYPRIKGLTGLPNHLFGDKYVLLQEGHMEDILEAINEIYNTKIENRESFEYNTGRKDIFGKDIVILQPTVVILDSLPMLETKAFKTDEIDSITAGGRKAIIIDQFYRKLTAICKPANILVIVINHLKDKPQLSPRDFAKPGLVYAKSNKNIPGGKAVLFLSHQLFYLDRDDFLKAEEDGVDGAVNRVSFWKTRSNKAGQSCILAFNQSTGYDPVLTLYLFAKDNGLIDGRNPKRYFVGCKETGPYFDDRKIMDYLENDPELITALVERTKPELMKMLSVVDSKDLDKIDEEMNTEFEPVAATKVNRKMHINKFIVEDFIKKVLVDEYGYDFDTIMSE